MGTACLRRSAFADARVQYRNASEIREGFDPAKLPGVTARLAGSLMNEGVTFRSEQKISEAEERFGRAEKLLLTCLTAERGAAEDFDLKLSQLYTNWGGMLNESGHFDEAVTRLGAGLNQLEPHLQIDPNDAGARQTCLTLHGNRALSLSNLGKHRESADDWKRVVELSSEPVPFVHRIRLAFELIYAGLRDQALAQAQLAKPDPGDPGGDCYNLGCLYSVCAASVRKDSSVSPAQRSRLVDSHIKDAMRWLRSAGEAGFFEKPGMRDHAKKDEDLAILADRAEFRQIIEPPQTKR